MSGPTDAHKGMMCIQQSRVFTNLEAKSERTGSQVFTALGRAMLSSRYLRILANLGDPLSIADTSNGSSNTQLRTMSYATLLRSDMERASAPPNIRLPTRYMHKPALRVLPGGLAPGSYHPGVCLPGSILVLFAVHKLRSVLLLWISARGFRVSVVSRGSEREPRDLAAT